MSKNKYDGRPFHVAMFVSRNKDNGHIKDFKQRTRSFLTQKFHHELLDEFRDFSNKGLKGEMSRFYLSLNDRNMDKVKSDLQHYLIDHSEANLVNMENLVSSLSMKKGTAKSKKFMFDFDNNSLSEVSRFVKEIEDIVGDSEKVNYHETPNGFVVTVDHGFDTRELLDKWEYVELKRDGMVFIDCSYKGVGQDKTMLFNADELSLIEWCLAYYKVNHKYGQLGSLQRDRLDNILNSIKSGVKMEDVK